MGGNEIPFFELVTNLREEGAHTSTTGMHIGARAVRLFGAFGWTSKRRQAHAHSPWAAESERTAVPPCAVHELAGGWRRCTLTLRFVP